MNVTNERAFDSIAWRLYKWGIRPDHISFLQLPVYLLMIGVALRAPQNLVYWLTIFGTLQILVVLLDGADGILARRTGTVTRRGHLLDSLFDIMGIGVTLWAVGYLHPGLNQWCFALLVLNFMVYIQNEIQGTKAITYTRGPATIGLYLQLFYPDLQLLGQPALAFLGVILPLAYGSLLMLTRLEWRQRLWNYYQFLTAGQRHEYKQTPPEHRARLRSPGGDGKHANGLRHAKASEAPPPPRRVEPGAR